MTTQRLIGKQAQSVHHATRRMNIWEGAVRSSKTVSSLIAWLKFVRTGPPGPLLMVGKTERTLTRNIIDLLIGMLGTGRCRLISGKGELWICGRLVYLVGANDEKAQDKIRGLTLAGAYVDELSTVPESFFSMLMTRLSIEGSRLFGTTNPDNPMHWLKVNYLDRSVFHINRAGDLTENAYGVGGSKPIDLSRFSFALYDNPNLPASYLRSMENEFSGLYYRRLILGEWCQAEGAIYDMWDEEKHVVDALPAIRQWISIGIDYGTSNPFAANLLALGADNCLYVAAEWYYDSKKQMRQLTDFEYADLLQAWAKQPCPEYREGDYLWWIVDPSAASFRVELKKRGIPQHAGDNSVLDGIRLVSSLFTRGKLKVHRRCEHLREEVPGYSWDDKAALIGEDKPIKAADHELDALRYNVTSTQTTWSPYIGEIHDALT